MARRTDESSGRRLYASGVEVVTGLAIGAAMVGAMVSLLVTVLLVRDVGIQRDLRASRLAAVVSGLVAGTDAWPERMQLIDFLLTAQGDVAGAVLVDSSGNLVSSLHGSLPGNLPEPVEGGCLESSVLRSGRGYDWYLQPVADSGVFVAIAIWEPSSWGSGRWVLYLLGGICAGLVVLAVATPKFLEQRVLQPLRGILREADKVMEGGGRTADTASSSFRQLVAMLSDRDRELVELRRRAEERADAAEARAGAIVGSMRSGIVALDAAGAILYFNRRAAELLDLRPDDLGKPFPAERSETLGSLWTGVMERALSGDGDLDDLEVSCPPDTVLSVSSARPSSSEIAVLLTDVTRIRQLERKLADEQAFSSLGFMATGIAHEMGNTLCALSGFVDLLGKGHSDPRSSSLIAEARAEVESAQKMIEAFRSYARPWKLEPRFVSSVRVRARTREICARWPDSCRFAESEPTPDGEVQLDPDAFATCLENAIRNAVEAGPQSGVEVRVTGSSDGAHLLVEVLDDGPGLPDDPEVLFRPFYTTHPEDGNTGMGLAVTRRL
ncbi:PAS domain-containing protein, partial [Candidatus Fermentibacterales bacterium]|nr:PAS domain-containing protein [Candidatus Fermentibacterales bacterium]